LLEAIWAPDKMAIEPEREPLSTEVRRLESEVGPHAHHPLVHLRVFEQLKQRNVFRVAILYLVVCWLILDPVHVVFHMLEVPAWANRLVVMLMAVGFPAVVIFAWVYEITPEGLRPTVEVPHGQSIRKLTGRRLDRAIIAVLAAALAYFVADKFWISKNAPRSSQPVTSAAPVTAEPTGSAPPAVPPFAPPPHSIAVLPFINLSGDPAQEYFSDGLTEELLNSLARIDVLQVAARTSAFSFKGADNDISTIGRKLNVGAVLEGSVRRSAHTVRVTAQLINTVTGFHLWSQTYDRNLGDVLQLQTEISNAVAEALKVTLLGDLAAKIEIGGTRNPAAFDAYLRGLRAARLVADPKELPIEAFTQAIRLDPNYALAFAARSLAISSYLGGYGQVTDPRGLTAKADGDARRAVSLAPALGEGHLALAALLATTLEFARAGEEYERALALAPGNATVLYWYSQYSAYMGRSEQAIAAAHRGVTLDPLNLLSHRALGDAQWFAHHYEDAAAAYQEAIAVEPGPTEAYARRGLAYYALGKFQLARASCEARPDHWESWLCLALTYDKLGQHQEAEAQLPRMQRFGGDVFFYQYAEIYAQWGMREQALHFLEAALQRGDLGFRRLRTDPLLDPVRAEPRFQAIERTLKFPPQ